MKINMIKKESPVFLFMKNLLIYTAIFVGSYYLYNYTNKNPKNIPHTDFSFVYAQF